MIQISRRVSRMVYVGISVILLLSGHNTQSWAASAPDEHERAPFESMMLFDAAEKTRLTHYFDQSDGAEMPVDISIPHLGTLPLERRIDSYSGRSLLQSNVEVDALSLPGDAVQLSSFTLMVLDTCECILQSEATVFGAPAVVEFESIQRRAGMRQRHEIDVEVTSAAFRLLFMQNPDVEVAPGHRVTLEDAELVLEEGESPVLVAAAEFLNELVELRFELSDDALELTFPFERLELSELDESLAESNIGSAVLTDITFTTRYETTPEGTQVRTSFAGRLDPATLPDECVRFKSERADTYQVRGEFIRSIEDQGADSQPRRSAQDTGMSEDARLVSDMADSAVDVTGSGMSEPRELLGGKQGGLRLVVSNCVCQVPFLGSFDDAELTICSSARVGASTGESTRSLSFAPEPSMVMHADGIFWFDEEQRVPYDLRLEWQDDECFIQGALNESVLLPKIVLENGSFVLDPEEEKLQLSGTAMLGDMKTDAIVTIDVSEEAGPADITVQGVGEHRPFEDRPIANIEDITLSHVEGVIPIFDDTIQLTGQAKILGNELPVVVEWSEGLGFAPTIKAALPKGSRFQDYFPRLTGTPLGRLVFNDAWLVASARDYQDPHSQVVYQAGLTLNGDAQFAGALEALSALVPQAVRSVKVYGKIEPEHEKTTLVGPLPLNVPFASDVMNLGPVVYQVGADLNWLLTTVGVRVGDGELIRFSGPLSITDRSIKGSLHADDGWQRPCGLPNISFRDLKLDLELDVEQVRKRALPDKLQLDMKLDFLDYPLRFTGTADNAFKSLVFKSSLRKLHLADLVYFLSDRLSIPCDRTLVPPLELYGVGITCAPQETHAGADFINKGVHLAGSTTLLGQKVDLNAEATSRGCVGTGTLAPIACEGMRFCGESEEDEGPAVRLAFCEDEQGLNITGRFVVDGLLDEMLTFDYENSQHLRSQKMVRLGALSQPVSMCIETDEFTADPVFDVSVEFRAHERDYYTALIHEMARVAEERMARERELAATRAEAHAAESRVLGAVPEPMKSVPPAKHPRFSDKKLRAMAASIRDAKKEIREFEEEIRQTRQKISEFENSRGASRARKRYEAEAERISSELKAAQKQLERYEVEYKQLKARQRAGDDVSQEKRAGLSSGLSDANRAQQTCIDVHGPESTNAMENDHVSLSTGISGTSSASGATGSSGRRPRFMSSGSSVTAENRYAQTSPSRMTVSSERKTTPMSRPAMPHDTESSSRIFRPGPTKQPIDAGAAKPLSKPTDMPSPYSGSRASYCPTASGDAAGVMEPEARHNVPTGSQGTGSDEVVDETQNLGSLQKHSDQQTVVDGVSCVDAVKREMCEASPALGCDIEEGALQLLKDVRLDDISWRGRCAAMKRGILPGVIVRYSTEKGMRVVHLDCNVSEGDETFAGEIVRAVQAQNVRGS